MSSVNCPYCKATQEINHDDGYGYGEDVLHEQRCPDCNRLFKFQTNIHFRYVILCNGDHDFEFTPTVGRSVVYRCKRCGTYKFEPKEQEK